MKIAIVNTFDSKDVKNWAGIPFYVSKMLERIFPSNVEYVCLPSFKRNLRSYILGFYYNKILCKKYYTWADNSLYKLNARPYKKLVSNEFDLIITFDFFLVPLLKSNNNKVIYWNDATLKNLINFYSGYSNLSNFSVKGGHLAQRKALEKSDFIILSSDWAINTAIDYYKTDRNKIIKILFASNLTDSTAKVDINEILKLRKSKVVRLLFLASEWDRKGGDSAVAVIDKLNDQGIESKLFVVGTSIPDVYKMNKNIISFGFLRKSLVEEEAKLISLLKICTYLILPSKADCTPVAFSEANSFALPVITTNIGGIPSIISKNVNGYYFDDKNFVDNASSYIAKNLPLTDHYDQLCHNSFNFYQREMSWNQVETKFKRILNKLHLIQ